MKENALNPSSTYTHTHTHEISHTSNDKKILKGQGRMGRNKSHTEK